jgi:hypothetical protein
VTKSPHINLIQLLRRKKNVNNEYVEIPELLEVIFAFLSRKDLYKSCTKVNHQWNSVSMRIIQKKRKSEFINIPGIRDNIIFHLYENRHNIAEIINYCEVSEIWSDILNHLHAKTNCLSVLELHKGFLNSSFNHMLCVIAKIYSK